MIRLFFILLLSLLNISAYAADNFTASVDRTSVMTGEQVQLRLSLSSSQPITADPNLSALTDSFDIQKTEQQTQQTNINGAVSSVTIWGFALTPKHEGTLVIPKIKAPGNNRLETEPFNITVTKAPKLKKNLLSFHADLDKDSAYIQEQVILTLSVKYADIKPGNLQLKPLKLPDVKVTSLGEPTSYQNTIDGKNYTIIKLKYALYPQKSTAISIPPQILTGVVQSNGTLQNIKLLSKALTLQVKPQPTSFPKNATWLPARSMSIREKWSKSLDKMKVGDTLSRQVIINAEGLTQSQIPPLPKTSEPGLRHYPDRPITHDEITGSGFTSSRKESDTFIFDQAGNITIPGKTIYWWNTSSDSLEKLTLPEKRFTVAKNPALITPKSTSKPVVIKGNTSSLWPWQVSTAIFFLTTLLGFGLYWKKGQKTKEHTTKKEHSTQQTLLQLKQACNTNDLKQARLLLDLWAISKASNLTHLMQNNSALAAEVKLINSILYGNSKEIWSGNALWKTIESTNTYQTKQEKNTDQKLPNLYPN